ncbi:diacylglycerol kinase [Geobacter sp. DSM 9736]|uniref:diacylglycerol kinase n=1 Tax=Geobacter sp. DSM 9736 TaxID=1277350 RepID=UPI000B507C4B|nr:diacylglycerol kinase [Geobacter sp. DSM 9736]SNB46429.1 diacylglycerol kinase (ATP) [Geobacter sp. DSM 9736]
MRNKPLGTGGYRYDPKRKILTVISGLRYAILYDFSVAYKIVLSVIVLGAALVMHRYVDVLLILLATGLVLITEIVNSAIEALCDFVEERHNEQIKVIKDVAAAAVGISIVIWVAVFAVELSEMWALMER